MEIIANDINSLFLTALKELSTADEVTVKDSVVTKEIPNMNLILTNPYKNILSVKKRYNNFPASVYETFWVLSGHLFLSDLPLMIRNVMSFSDDYPNKFEMPSFYNSYCKLATWRGAYGPRLGHQIQNVILNLHRDPNSRQAIIVIGNEHDYNPGMKTNDRPCTLFLHFMIRNNKLDMFVRMRSNDVIWGCFNINIFEFTMLQQIVAMILGYQVGTYYHNSDSFHIYNIHYKRASNILSENDSNDNLSQIAGMYTDMPDYNFKMSVGIPETSCFISNGRSDDEIRDHLNRFFRMAYSIANPEEVIGDVCKFLKYQHDITKQEPLNSETRQMKIYHKVSELVSLIDKATYLGKDNSAESNFYKPYTLSTVLIYLYSIYEVRYKDYTDVLDEIDLFKVFYGSIKHFATFNPMIAIALLETFVRKMCGKNDEYGNLEELIRFVKTEVIDEFMTMLETEHSETFTTNGLNNARSFILGEIE